MRTRHSLPTLRSVARWFPVLLCQALTLAVPTPANAHGDTVNVVVTGQREGHVTTEITWENDADPIDEAVAATVNAVSPDGTRSAGPWKLVRDSGKETSWASAETLPPGNWKVSVDVGFPSLGHGEREIAVPAVDPPPAAPPATAKPSLSPTPSTSAASPSTPSPAISISAAADTADSDTSSGHGTLLWIAIALAGAACGVLVRRARSRTEPHR
ncbi:hypothetical protein ACIPJK_39330 [Streptomyces roseus]|uniref:hypothetical protein n=1 Tax=Streptomyces roseus TaxID=66430 RepID=UPI0038125CA2